MIQIMGVNTALKLVTVAFLTLMVTVMTGTFMEVLKCIFSKIVNSTNDQENPSTRTSLASSDLHITHAFSTRSMNGHPHTSLASSDIPTPVIGTEDQDGPTGALSEQHALPSPSAVCAQLLDQDSPTNSLRQSYPI